MVSYPNQITGPVTITGGGTADSWAVTGNETVGGTLTVTGATTMTGTANQVNGDLSIASTDVAGGFFLANTSTVTSGADMLLNEHTAGSNAFGVSVSGDSATRFLLTADGVTHLGPGNAARDVAVGRTGAGVYGVSTGSLAVTTAGQGFQCKEGANAKMGTATLNGTTEVTVSTTAVTASSRIQVTTQAPGGTVGAPYVSSRVAGTSFGLKSTVVGDTSTVAWIIIEPA